MLSVFLGYALLLLVLTVSLGALAGYAWDHRERRGAKPFAVVLVGQAIWCACAAAALLTRGTWWALFWSRAWFVGVTITMAGLLVFSLEYTGREQYLGPRTYALLSVEPILLMGVAAFAPAWLYSIEGASATRMLGFEIVEGTAFWLHAGYSYSIIVVSSVLIIWFALTSDTIRRRQAVALIVALFIPWFGNAFYLFTDFGIDTTPLTFAVTGIALSYAIFRADLLDISPIAHREIVESLSSSVFVVNDENVVTAVNDAGANLLDGRAVVGRPVAAVFDHWPELRDVLADGAESEETRTELHHDGRHFEARITPLYDDRGDSLGRTALVHDITEQKARETELQRRNRQLDKFASVVSHDLRNPLSVASGSLELARETGDDDHFDRVESAHERMSRLIDDVLALSREGDSSESSAHELSELAETAWTHVDTGGATLQVETEQVVHGNETQLLQLFENAFRNSIEHGGDEVTVTVAAIPDPTGDSQSGFVIADDGPGIPEDERDLVFDHGYSADSAGTGLGLAIIEHVVASHDWSVRAAASDAGGLALEVTDVELSNAEPPEQRL